MEETQMNKLIKSHAEFLTEKFPGFTIDFISHEEPGVVVSEVRGVKVVSSIEGDFDGDFGGEDIQHKIEPK